MPRTAVEVFTGTEDPPPRHVIHLPIAVADLGEAVRFAYTLARSLASLPGVEAAGTAVSAEDVQHVRHWVFCDQIMPGRRRCARRAGHGEPCEPGD
ncbi:hypothetical protein K7640_05510 [Micromonospora sp. PLK6-60]|nr:hypothetical protein [Micromonospora sp. PLK6-60]MBY8871300.1 hypothetical protein [Micromonospora sp. PLK6-60]